MLPQKILKYRVLQMPFAVFSAGLFRRIDTQENAAVSGLFYPCLALSVTVQCLLEKRRQVTQTELWNDKKLKEILTQRHRIAKKYIIHPD